MALNRNRLVPLPERGIIKYKNRGTTYIYHITRIYRNDVEKSFDDLKNELDMKRLHCHSDETTEGKMFVAFFALILRSCMQNKLREYLAETGQAFSSVLKELRKMKYVHTRDGKKLLSPVTKKQRDILDACDLCTDDLPVWLASIPV